MDNSDPTGAILTVELDDSQNLSPEARGAETATILPSSDATEAPGLAVSLEAEEPVTAPEVSPIRPLPLPLPFFQNVSGRYRGLSGAFQLELRVDVDRVHALRKLSGDFYTVSGGTLTYFGSFIVDAPAVSLTSTGMTARGAGRFTWSAGYPVVEVRIPRRRIWQAPAPASLQFFNATGSPGAYYPGQFESSYFRTVRLETDRVSDVTTPMFSSYNTGAAPSGGPVRTLSVATAYAEAGVQIVASAGADVIDVSEAGSNHTWSDSELHASMVRHFSLYRNEPQWSVWQVVCQLHDIGPNLYGIMFDQSGLQRQGCAVFHAGIGGTTADKLKLQLYTYVHELGHCFNLLHSWQKSFAVPPQANRPSALSWMNYPWNYPGGATAFWNAFPFQFDDPELLHVRHAFRNNVIMGGQPFGNGSAILDPEALAEPVKDDSGLEFRIEPAHPSFSFGEPVVMMLRLRCHDRRGKSVQPCLHPKTGMTSIAIARPNGQVVRYEPYIDHLMASEPQFLKGDETIEDSAYIGFGKGGIYFDQPGLYRLCAIYHAQDGSRVMSNVAMLRVRYPTTGKEQDLAELLLGEEQGALFWLLGSESESLSNGRAAFDEVLARHGDHPLANYVRLVRGVNFARTNVIFGGSGRVEVRHALLEEANAMLTAATAPASRVDDLSKLLVLGRLEQAQRKAGDSAAADTTRNRKRGLSGSRR